MRRDPHERAERLYQQIHWGKPATRHLRVLAAAGSPDSLPCIGVFLDLELEDGRRWPDPARGESVTDTVWLATDEEGNDLYFAARGGFKPGPGTPRGRIAAISYVSDKNDGNHTYRHEFGEGPSNGQLPGLGVDANGYAVFHRLASAYYVDWQGIQG